MKNTVLIGLFFLLAVVSNAQNIDDVGKIALSVVMPRNTDKLKSSEFEKLESKIQQITAKNGIAGNGYNTNFVIVPKFEIFEDETLNAGLTLKKYIKGELSLYVSQVDNSLIYNSTAISVKGVGEEKDKAILNAIANINVNNEDLNKFFIESKEKIIQYYANHCEQIIDKADALIKKQQYEEAIGLLLIVPEEVSICYQKIQIKSIEAYLAYQDSRCKETILKAKAKIANKDLYTALNLLSDIDPKSNCYADSEHLISKIGEEFTKNADREYNDNKELIKKEIEERKQRFETSSNIEVARINAIKELAISFYKNKPSDNPNSIYLVR